MYHEDQDHLTLSLCLSNAKPHNKHFSYAVWNRLMCSERGTREIHFVTLSCALLVPIENLRRVLTSPLFFMDQSIIWTLLVSPRTPPDFKWTKLTPLCKWIMRGKTEKLKWSRWWVVVTLGLPEHDIVSKPKWMIWTTIMARKEETALFVMIK